MKRSAYLQFIMDRSRLRIFYLGLIVGIGQSEGLRRRSDELKNFCGEAEPPQSTVIDFGPVQSPEEDRPRNSNLTSEGMVLAATELPASQHESFTCQRRCRTGSRVGAGAGKNPQPALKQHRQLPADQERRSG